MPNVLIVAPKNPRGFWSFEDAMIIAGKEALFQPAGALTVSSDLPEDYHKTFVDTNIEPLRPEHFKGIDAVISSRMIIHWEGMEKIIAMANEMKVPSFVGGPLSTQYAEKLQGNTTHFLGEAEAGFQKELADIIEEGYVPEKRIINKRGQFADLSKTPLQDFDLIKDIVHLYGNIAIQLTRGCFEKCTFCNIPALYGKDTRMKASDNVLAELDILYDLLFGGLIKNWNGAIMFVDDNLVGNPAIKTTLLDVAQWQKERNYPFAIFTQATMRMYDDPDLMEAMYQAGIDQVFFGLESPSRASLKSMGAQKNIQSTTAPEVPLADKVKNIQKHYFKAQSGFILGLDKDPDNIDQLMIDFIQEAMIGISMVGTLGILPDTADYTRFSRQGRLKEDVVYGGDSGMLKRELSYVPWDQDGNEIDPHVILDRHRNVIKAIWDPKNYFSRTLSYLKEREREPLHTTPTNFGNYKAFLRSVLYQGMTGDYKKEYWKYLANVLTSIPSKFPDAVRYAVEGHHTIKTAQASLQADTVNRSIESLLEKMGYASRDSVEKLITHLKDIGHTLSDSGKEHLDHVKDVVTSYQKLPERSKSFVLSSYRALIETSPS